MLSIALNATKLGCDGLWVVNFQNDVRQLYPPPKMAAITEAIF
jgi:hypothetical protein